ncbi:glycosyltransferase [Parabacteroides bouchesdurhonensis]|uniref:glycosyltransferase n=1 Tax=Parabacteroides bouchesdurhonensis TaxID=1936995 RepID=UPI000C8227D0|nr:glycosyltransferase [Parabacteroides bouchesdurhonensis]
MKCVEKISVVMCTYNGAKYLKEQLDSIINQTYPIYEMIIQDDCSTDDTMTILQEYANKFSYIKVFQNFEQKGINKNFFSAIIKATGDYIAISDQDDIWELDKIEYQINSIGDDWLSSGFSRPFVNGRNINCHFDRRIPNCTLERMMYVGVTPGHTMLFKKNVMGKIPHLDKYMCFYTYDKVIQMVVAAYGKIQFCDHILVNNRRHIQAATYTPSLSYEWNFLNVLKSIYRTFKLRLELKDGIKEYFGKTFVFLQDLPMEAIYKDNAIKMALYQSRGSFVSYIKLIFLCVKLRNKIFYSPEKNLFFSVFRALFFPISCSDYFRYMSKSFKK